MNIYNIISLITSSIMLVLFFVLFFLHTPERKEWRFFKLATNLIAVACLVLCASYLYSSFQEDSDWGDDGLLESFIILSVGGYQALLFTITSIVLISHTSSIWVRAIRHAVSITSASVVFIAAYWIFPAWRMALLTIEGTAYLAYIIYLTTYFNRNFRRSVKHIEDVYDDDMMNRLRWVRTFFYGALGVGLVSLLAAMVPNPELRLLFDVSVSIYYTYVAIRLVNYVSTSSFVVKTFTIESTPDTLPADTDTECQEDSLCQLTDTPAEAEGDVGRAIEAWVAARRYAVPDATVEEIVAELHVSKTAFSIYFKNVLNIKFRTWRRELRIREAMRMMDENPSLPINELISSVGYTDRSNFYKDFRHTAGVTLKEYRDRL